MGPPCPPLAMAACQGILMNQTRATVGTCHPEHPYKNCLGVGCALDPRGRLRLHALQTKTNGKYNTRGMEANEKY